MKEIGPKERLLREQREETFANKGKSPSKVDLRAKIAKVHPKIKKTGRRGR